MEWVIGEEKRGNETVGGGEVMLWVDYEGMITIM